MIMEQTLLNLWKDVVKDMDVDSARHMTIAPIYYHTKLKIEQAQKSGKTAFLVEPLLESALTRMLPFYQVPMQDVINGGYLPKRKRLEELQKRLFESGAKSRWKAFSEELAENITQAGLRIDPERFRDISQICDVLLDALTFFDAYATKIHRIRKGEDSCEKAVFLDAMPRFHTPAEFAEAFLTVERPCCIVFAAIAPTYRQFENQLEKWVRGSEEERIRNLRRNRGMTDGQIDAETDVSHAQIVIGIKRGGNFWIVQHFCEVPWKGEFTSYGERKSYLPYQIFFKGANGPEDQCTALAVPREAYKISGLADEEQSLWLPAFLWDVKQRFFGKDLPQAETVEYFGESGAVHVLGMGKSERASSLPAIRETFRVSIDAMRVPEGIAAFPLADKIFSLLEIGPEDIQGLPLTPQNFLGTKEEFRLQSWKNARYALGGAAMKKFHTLFNTEIEEDIAFYIKHCRGNVPFLLEQLSIPGSRVWEISYSVINGRQIFHPDGTPKIKADWRGTEIECEKTTADNGRVPRNNSFVRFKEFFPPIIAGKRPPAFVSIAPETPEDLALLCGIREEELPRLLRLMELFRPGLRYCSDETGKDPMYRAVGLLDPLCRLNLSLMFCFGKREFHSILGDTPPAPENIFWHRRNHPA